MDRTQAFVNYGGILDSVEDWMTHGYDREHPDTPVIPPRFDVATINNPDTDEMRKAHQEPRNSADQASAVRIQRDHPAQLTEIAGEIRQCRLCDLYLTRPNTVPGIGAADVVLLVVTAPPMTDAGEGDSPLPPSESEYLNRWLTALKLRPVEDVFVTPVTKCRTPGGRIPRPEEAQACLGYLHRQFSAVAPQALLILGEAACRSLTGNPRSFRELVGKDWTWNGVPSLVLWSPAEVLADPEALRRPVWDALQRLEARWNASS